MSIKKSSWERDFPLLTQIFKQPKRTTKKFLMRLLASYEKAVRWIIVIGTVLVMIYVFYCGLVVIGCDPSLNIFEVNKVAIKVYKAYRNFFYMLWIISGIPLLTLGIVYWKKDGFSRFLKLFLIWWGILLFITFSYAIASLAVDMICLIYYFHNALLKTTF